MTRPPSRSFPSALRGPERSAQRRLGTGLVSINADVHKRHRRLVAPLFHGRAREAYRDAIVSITSETLDGWRCGQRRDILLEMNNLAVKISGSTLFSLDDPELARTTAI